MHPLLNPLTSTFFSFLLLPLTSAHQIDRRQTSSNNANILACDTRNLPETNINADSVFNITSACIAQFQTNCSSSSGRPASVEIPSLNLNQIGIESYLCGQGFSNVLPKITAAVCYCACRCTDQEGGVDRENTDQASQQVQAEEMCSSPDGEIPASCLKSDQASQQVQAEEMCAADGENPASCVSLVQSVSVSSVASVSTSAWSNYTATVTGSAPASISSPVKNLGPQEGFERKRRV